MSTLLSPRGTAADPSVKRSISLPVSLWAHLEAEAAAQVRSLSGQVRHLAIAHRDASVKAASAKPEGDK